MPSRAASAVICSCRRSMARLVSVIWWWKCLATLYLLMTRPSATPISSAPVSRPAAMRAMIGSSRFSVAVRRSSRLRARSVANCGLRHQPLAGVVGVGDLGQVVGVEQAHLQRPVIAGELGDRGGAQRGDPPDVAV